MKKIFLSLCVMLSLFLSYSCSNISLSRKAEGNVEAKYLSDEELPGVEKAKILSEIRRSENLSMGFMSGAFLEVTPHVGSFLHATTAESLKAQAYKEMWPDGIRNASGPN